MRHREAIAHLSDFAAGSADPDIEEAVSSHARRCSACRDWLAAYELMACGLPPVKPSGDDHPESHLLALCAVRSEEVYEPDRERLRAHLGLCSSCRGAMRLASDAVREAKPRRIEAPSAAPPTARLNIRWQRLVPAALVVLSVASGLLVGVRLLHRHASWMSGLGDEPVALALPEDAHGKLSGYEIEGVRVISADQPLTVANLTVKSGADVTFLAHDVIAFGNGFKVAEGARIRVTSRLSAPEEARGDGGARPDDSPK